MSTRRHLLRLLAGLAVLHAACAYPGRAPAAGVDEPDPAADPIKDRLDKSKETHRARVDAIRKDVLDAIEQKIAAARKKRNNKAGVDRLVAEREAFKEDVNAVPRSLRDADRFTKRQKAVNMDLHRAYVLAIRDYTAAGKDAQATAIQTEWKAFRLKSTPVVAYQRERDGLAQPGEGVARPPALGLDPKILIRSSWNFVIRGNVTSQPGAFRIVDGVIYHTNTTEPVGSASIDGPGRIHLIFVAHRKISGGEAVVDKIANGEFRGQLEYQFGVYAFEMSRR